MTEEQITAIYEFDREVFNSDRRHNENTVRLFDNENNSTLAVYDNYSSDNRYGWLDEIDNMESYSKIMAMPKMCMVKHRIGQNIMHKKLQKERRTNMMKYGMAEILENQARVFVEKEFADFDESAKERYLKAILDYIYRNYPSSKDVA
jgi:uncharacterized membrane protein YheB (UPF0754 family)